MAAERNKNPRSTGIFAWYVNVQNNTQSQEILGDMRPFWPFRFPGLRSGVDLTLGRLSSFWENRVESRF